jgi:hypothetical protein
LRNKRSRSKEGACIYCGTVGALTDDHVPPKNLFPKPRLGLITVPSCERCNGGFKLDDEYFRLVITTSADAKVFPIAVEAIHKLGTPEKVRFAKSMLLNIDRENDDLNVDPSRVRRVIERVIRGLFWHHQRRALPAQAEMRVWFKCFDGAPMDDLGFEGLLVALGQQHLHQVGKGIFSYRYVFDSDQAVRSAWYLRFFETNEVLAIVVGAPDGWPGLCS